MKITSLCPALVPLDSYNCSYMMQPRQINIKAHYNEVCIKAIFFSVRLALEMHLREVEIVYLNCLPQVCAIIPGIM